MGTFGCPSVSPRKAPVSYFADPGGRFSSDTHRRVLGHLSYPNDNYGWSVPAMVGRMIPDVGTNISSIDEMAQVLEDLEADGHAERLSTPDGEIWRMTQSGFDTLTGPIANEPGPDAAVVGPAVVGGSISATLIGDGRPVESDVILTPNPDQAPEAPAQEGDTGAASNPA